VFVSSTFEDLEKHRDAVINAIRQHSDTFVISMEDFGARDKRPKDECLKQVRESDIFVGIYAHRYGHIPEGDEVSITEAEYDEALSAGLPCLIYLLNDDTPWKKKFIDTDKKQERLARFKDRLRARHVYKEFSSPDNLSASASADLGRVLQDILYKELARVHPDGTSTPPGRSTTPELKTRDKWHEYRTNIYKQRDGIFLVHSLTPSQTPGQLLDVFIYLLQHPRREQPRADLSSVDYAEFFLGEGWGDRVFKVPNEGHHIGIVVSAYGPFLCTCRITYKDRSQVLTDRCIDFESTAELAVTRSSDPEQP
jgi:hypothetical protein